MPLRRSKDSKGTFYQWGGLTKYYYTTNNKRSRELAKHRAQKQAGAVFASRQWAFVRK